MARVISKDLSFAARNNRLNVVQYCVKNGAKDFNRAMNGASLNNNLNIVKFCIKNGAKDFNKSMNSASLNGNLGIVKFFIKAGATNFDESIRIATFHGHLSIIEYYIKSKNRIDKIIDIMYVSVNNGHLNIIEYCLDDKEIYRFYQSLTGNHNDEHSHVTNFHNSDKTINYNSIMEHTVYGGNLNVVRFCIRHGADSIYKSMKTAALYEHCHIIKYYIKFDEGKKNMVNIMCIAIDNGFLDIVKYCLRNKKTYLQCQLLSIKPLDNHLDGIKFCNEDETVNYNNIIRYAIISGNLDVIKFCIKNGATDISDVLNTAICKDDLDTVKLIIKNGKASTEIIIDSIYTAIYYNRLDITRFIIDNGTIRFNDVINYAILHNDLDIIKICIKDEIDDIDDTTKDMIIRDLDYLLSRVL